MRRSEALVALEGVLHSEVAVHPLYPDRRCVPLRHQPGAFEMNGPTDKIDLQCYKCGTQFSGTREEAFKAGWDVFRQYDPWDRTPCQGVVAFCGDCPAAPELFLERV
jgi:hypothetical protein